MTRQFLAPAARPMERAGTCNTSAQQNGKHDESFPEMVRILSGKFYFGSLVYSSNYRCPTLSAFIPNEKHGRYNKCESATVACVFNYLGKHPNNPQSRANSGQYRVCVEGLTRGKSPGTTTVLRGPEILPVCVGNIMQDLE